MKEIKKFEVGKLYAKREIFGKASKTAFIKITNVGKVYVSFVFMDSSGKEYTLANMKRAKIRIDTGTEFIVLPIGLSGDFYSAKYEKKEIRI